MNEKMERFKRMYLDECQEHLAALESTLSAIKAGGRERETINEAFRAIHSIKGGAAMFEFERIVPYAHAFETVLDKLRLMEIPATEALAAAALRATDRLADLVKDAGGVPALPAGSEDQAIDDLLEAVARAATGANDMPAQAVARQTRRFTIGFQPHAEIMLRGNDPLLIIGRILELGKAKVAANLSALPPLAQLRPSRACIDWRIDLVTDQGEAAIRDAFQFAEADCTYSIMPANDAPPAPAPMHDGPSGKPGAINSIRVDVDRVDRLVNLAGEIAISQALVAQQIDQSLFATNPRLFQHLSQLLQHIQNLQDGVMAIRAQPIGTIFDRMPRLVRELSTATGKPLTLRVSGEATEIDKTVIEQLSDPIMHMIRNAADHGIEDAGDRVRIGKPVDGAITLKAEQRGNRIVIEVGDDGRGLDRDRILAKAVAVGIVLPGADLAPGDIDELIFHPGFSTAGSVTSLSGRGVGMDVVKRNIQKIGGRVGIRTEPGKGTTIVLTLPLTLAVLEGMIVRTASESYVIPISNIVECLADWRSSAGSIPGLGAVLGHRNGYVRIYELGAIFDSAHAKAGSDSVAVILEIDGGEKLAVVVDDIVGQQQVVIKSIARNLDAIPGIAGATILGDGRVALIIDAAEIPVLAARNSAAALPLAADPPRRKIA